MLEPLAASMDRELVVPPLAPLRVPAPTVRAALAIQSAARAEHQEGERPEALRTICAKWLPLRTFSVLFSGAFTPRRRIGVLGSLLQSSTPDRIRKAAEGEDSADKDSDWHYLLARYRSVYGGSFQEVLDEPWHVFLSHLEQAGRLQAQEQVRFIRAYTAIRSSNGESILDQILDVAQGAEPEAREELDEEKKKDRRQLQDKLVAEAYQKRQHLMN